jgi:hypothetical protein
MRFKLKSVHLAGLAPRAAAARKRARTMMTLAAIGDTRPYVPRLSGALAGSGDSESQPERGLLIYGSSAVPYARAQYYGLPNKTLQHHPQATKEWFAVSKAANMRKWDAVAKQEYRKEF